MAPKDLRIRLIDFSVLIIEIVNKLNKCKAGNHLGGQLVRSGTSTALNYGEAQSAESKKDFVHKMKIGLKELRESEINLQIIQKAKLSEEMSYVKNAISECNELISIFVASINTAQKK